MQDVQIRCVGQLLRSCALLEKLSVEITDFAMDEWAKCLVTAIRHTQLGIKSVAQALRCLELVRRRPVDLWSFQCAVGLTAKQSLPPAKSASLPWRCASPAATGLSTCMRRGVSHDLAHSEHGLRRMLAYN